METVYFAPQPITIQDLFLNIILTVMVQCSLIHRTVSVHCSKESDPLLVEYSTDTLHSSASRSKLEPVELLNTEIDPLNAITCSNEIPISAPLRRSSRLA